MASECAVHLWMWNCVRGLESEYWWWSGLSMKMIYSQQVMLQMKYLAPWGQRIESKSRILSISLSFLLTLTLCMPSSINLEEENAKFGVWLQIPLLCLGKSRLGACHWWWLERLRRPSSRGSRGFSDSTRSPTLHTKSYLCVLWLYSEGFSGSQWVCDFPKS